MPIEPKVIILDGIVSECLESICDHCYPAGIDEVIEMVYGDAHMDEALEAGEVFSPAVDDLFRLLRADLRAAADAMHQSSFQLQLLDSSGRKAARILELLDGWPIAVSSSPQRDRFFRARSRK